MATLFNIDLSKFPEIPKARPLWGFVPLVDLPVLNKYPDIAERIYGCMHFLRIETKYSENITIEEKCNLRAALSDFVSINDMIKESNNPQLITVRFDTLSYPLIHFFKLLRDTNIHLESIRHIPSTKTYLFGSIATGETMKNKDGKDYVETWNNFTIDNCSPNTLAKCRNINRYRESDIQAITEWVNINQHEYGLQYLLELALRQYCEEIVAAIYRIV